MEQNINKKDGSLLEKITEREKLQNECDEELRLLRIVEEVLHCIHSFDAVG